MTTGYEIREGSRMIAERVEPERPEVRVLVHSVGFYVQRQHETGRYDSAAAGEIDRFGHITLRRTKPHMATDLADYEERVAARHDEMTEALLDEGLAEWRQVGPSETELYATQDLLRLVAAPVAALPRDWQRWPR